MTAADDALDRLLDLIRFEQSYEVSVHLIATVRDELQRLREEVDRAWIGSQIALCEEFIRAADNDETFGVEDIQAKLILLTQAER